MKHKMLDKLQLKLKHDKAQKFYTDIFTINAVTYFIRWW